MHPQVVQWQWCLSTPQGQTSSGMKTVSSLGVSHSHHAARNLGRDRLGGTGFLAFVMLKEGNGVAHHRASSNTMQVSWRPGMKELR